jgi:hypothetical protein
MNHKQQAIPLKFTLSLLFLYVVVTKLFPFEIFYGQVLGPIDLLYHYEPWKSVLGKGFKFEIGSYTLSDQMDSVIPTLHFAFNKMKDYNIPWFSDQIQNGVPLFGPVRNEMKSLPLLLLGIILPFNWAWNLYLLLKVALGSLFYSILCREYKLNWYCIFWGLICFSLSSYSIQRLGIRYSTQYFILPMLFWLVIKNTNTYKASWLIFLSLAIAQMMLLGYPSISIMTYICLTLYSLFLALKLSGKVRANFLLRYMAASFGALIIVYPFFLETTRFFTDFDWSYRKEYWRFANELKYLTGFFSPYILESRESSQWIRKIVFFGTAPSLILMISVFLKDKSKNLYFFIYLTAGFIFICYKFPFSSNFFSLLPIVNTSMPNMFIIFIPFFGSVAVAIASHIIVCSDFRWRIFQILFLSIFIFLYLYYLVTLKGVGILSGRATLEIFTAFTLVVMLVFRSNKVALFISILFTLFQLSSMAKGYNRSIDTALFYPKSNLTNFLQQNVGDGKILVFGKALLANGHLPYDLNVVGGRGFFNHRTKRLYSLIDPNSFKSMPTQHIFKLHEKVNLGSIIEGIGIKYLLISQDEISNWEKIIKSRNLTGKYKLVFDEKVQVWENQKYAGRAYAVGTTKHEDINKLYDLVAADNFDFMQIGFFEPDVKKNPSVRNGKFVGKVTSLDKYKNINSQRYIVDFSHDGYLVIPDNYFKGWTATVSNKAVDINRINLNMRGIFVSAGRHEIRLVYNPTFGTAGPLYMLILAILILFSLNYVIIRFTKS